MERTPRPETPAPAGYDATLLDCDGRASWGVYFAGTAVAAAITALLMLHLGLHRMIRPDASTKLLRYP